jgi:hypothetical protein
MSTDLQQPVGLAPLLGLLVFALYVVGGQLIYLLREHHTQTWRELGSPSILSIWRIFRYVLRNEYASLSGDDLRRPARAFKLLCYAVIIAAIAHFSYLVWVGP